MKTNSEVSKLILYMAEHGQSIAEAFRDKNDIIRDQLLPWEITDQLIRAAGLAETHLSDFLITLNGIIRDIKEQDDAYYVFGIRRGGIDSNSYFNCRMNEFYEWNNYTALNEFYRKIYVLEYHLINNDKPTLDPLWAYRGQLQFTLKDVTGAHPFRYPEKEKE